MQPIVGITGRRASDNGRAIDGMEVAYIQAVSAAGGIPFIVPVMGPSNAQAVIQRLDAVLLTGGRDVEADWYQSASVPEAEEPEPERDAWELMLAHSCLGHDVPLLAICRGEQLLNIVAGGSLIQHLPAVTEVAHRRPDLQNEKAHLVRIEPTSLLASIVGPEDLGVNTLHHQAIDKVAPGLRAVAWAEDGTIEAVEALGKVRALGVQWHPELMFGDQRHAALFSWLVDEAVAQRSSEVEGAEALLASAPKRLLAGIL